MSFRTSALAAVLAVPAFCPGMAAAEPVKVVASFSIIGDFARQVGGDRIALTTLVGPDGDAHVYEPRPADAAAMAKADVILVNGLGFEGFLQRLVETSGTKAAVATLSEGVVPLPAAEGGHDHAADQDGAHADRSHGAVDPHAFQSIANARIYVANVAKAFCTADSAGCATYRANAARYDAELASTDTEVKAGIEAIPPDRRRIITSHDAFGYFAKTYGVTFLAPEGVSTDSEASAAEVAALVRQVAEDRASAIFVENITDPRLIEQIAAETGLRVGGALYSDALSGPDGPASTYVDMMLNNVRTLRAAILGE